MLADLVNLSDYQVVSPGRVVIAQGNDEAGGVEVVHQVKHHEAQLQLEFTPSQGARRIGFHGQAGASGVRAPRGWAGHACAAVIAWWCPSPFPYGNCFFCSRQLFAACEATNPGRGAILNKKDTRAGAGLFGYSHLYGGYAGGQAEFVRVPKANVGPLVIPESTLADEQVLFLSDILPTGFQAVRNARVGLGSTLAIFGAGPVGLMAAACARMMGVDRIFMVDHHSYRLDFAAATYGVEPINFDRVDDPAAAIIDATDFRGVDASIDKQEDCRKVVLLPTP